MQARHHPRGQHSSAAAEPRDMEAQPSAHWARCPRHPWMYVSVLVTADAQPWCIGDGDTLPGHWVTEKVAA